MKGFETSESHPLRFEAELDDYVFELERFKAKIDRWPLLRTYAIGSFLLKV